MKYEDSGEHEHRHGSPGRRKKDSEHAELDWLAEQAIEINHKADTVAKAVQPVKRIVMSGYAVLGLVAASIFWLGGLIMSPREVQADMKNRVDASITRLDTQFRERSDSLAVQQQRNFAVNKEVTDSLQKAVEELRNEIRALSEATRMNTYLNCVQLRRNDPAAVPASCYSSLR